MFFVFPTFQEKYGIRIVNGNKTSSKGSDVKLEKKKEKSFNLSYESDGKMGKNKKETNLKKEGTKIFFNNTQNSE